MKALEALQVYDSALQAHDSALQAHDGALQARGGDAMRAASALADAIQDAHSCFEGWGLVPDQAREIIEDLKTRGALASKLTGAGGGGMVVALWPEAGL